VSLTAIVCTYERAEHLKRCIDSLVAQNMPDLQLLLVLVDGDERAEQVAVERGLRTVIQPRGGGIAEARNIGVEQADTEFVAFIDDDARARPGWAPILMAGFKESVGGVGGAVIDTRTGEQVVHEWWVDPFGITHGVEEPATKTPRIPTINGCNMAFRRKALLQIGGFDPYYRYYYDETDVCIRLANAGFQVRFVNDAIVDHDFADGPTRESFIYYSSKMRAYFSLKNFRNRVSTSRLLAEQARLFRHDLGVLRRQRSKYEGSTGILRAWCEMVRGRIEGAMDGIAASPFPSLEASK